jgi:hypothetical protein
MDDAQFQELLRYAQSVYPATGNDAVDMLGKAWNLYRMTADARAAEFGDVAGSNLQAKMDAVINLSLEFRDLPGPLSIGQVEPVRNYLADSLVEANALRDAIERTNPGFFATYVDFFKNYTTYAGEGAQAIGSGLSKGIDAVVGFVLDKPITQLGMLVALVWLMKRK